MLKGKLSFAIMALPVVLIFTQYSPIVQLMAQNIKPL